MYVNGELVYTFEGVTLSLSGRVGLCAAAAIPEDPNDNTTFFDHLDGHILGFASYNSALGEEELTAHYEALAGGGGPGTPDFRVTVISLDPQSGNITLTWNSVPGRNYGVYYSTDLKPPLPVNTAVPGTAGATTTLTFPPPVTPAARLFFMIRDTGN